MSLNIDAVDISVIIFYLVGVVGLGCWAAYRQRKSDKKENNYFLAGKTLSWPVIGLALFSTNISTIHLVSLAQSGYETGLVMGNFEWMAAFILIILALFFAPFYLKSRVTTLPDFLEKRYNRSCRDWFAVVSIISAIVVHIGFSLYTSALVLNGLLGLPIMVSIIAISILTGLYTIIGGLLAVVITESIQTIVLLIGAFCITIIGYNLAGGWERITSHVPAVQLTMLRPEGDPSDLPWYSIILGYPILGIWYWCTDQTIVQRILGAKNENHARVGPLFAGFLKILPVFIMVLPGVICLSLINQGKLPNELTKSENTYAFMIQHILPSGLKGIVAAASLAAVMSTVSGALNSIATLFSYDIYKRFKPEATEKSIVTVGRLVTFLAMILSIVWSPFVSHFGSIFSGLSKVIGYIAPPITTVFLFGVFWKKASDKAALLTLWVGSLLGVIIFFLDWFGYINNIERSINFHIPFMMIPVYLFVICSLLLILFSNLWKVKHTEESAALVWNSPFETFKSKAWKGIGNYKLLSVVLFITMICLYIIFS